MWLERFWNHVPAIYICSLHAAAARQERTKMTLQQLGVPPQKVYVNQVPRGHIKPKDGDQGPMAEYSKWFQGTQVLSVADNHMMCMRDALQKQLPWCMIFEDDVLLRPGVTSMDIEESLLSLQEFIESKHPYDIIYLGHFGFWTRPLMRRFSIVRTFSVMMHAYCISARGMQRILQSNLLQQCKPSKWMPYLPHDVVVCKQAVQGRLRCYALFPYLFDQDSVAWFPMVCRISEAFNFVCGAWIIPVVALIIVAIIILVKYFRTN